MSGDIGSMLGKVNVIKNQKLLINLLIGLGLLSIPIVTSPDINSDVALFSIQPFQRNFLSYSLLTFFFFFSYYIIIPNFYFKKKWYLFTLFLVLGYLLVIEFPQVVIDDSDFTNGFHMRDRPHKTQDGFSFFSILASSQNHFLQYIGIFFLSLFLRVNERLYKTANDKLLAEISYLKSQINPHFLFNTLNSLYALSLSKSKKAPEAILKLSNLMRYVVAESNQQYISLGQEVNYIKDFIDLQKLRLTDKTNLKTHFEGDFEKYNITPLVLICIIENAFKYGSDVENSSNITISMVVVGSKLNLEVTNTIVNLKENSIQSTERGIQNTRKQLDLFYENDYILNIKNGLKTYTVNLQIKLR
ncbi:histidine kinase [Cellulophaga baltica]|uniref:sensor histidine kinase n=1 Tax=Cellulophaga TaxID=104264 RepID=UPI001C064CA5|nr:MULTISPECIES: sensor histidine kinase [Cellulophaga]MBU2995826.1 histidine kinase [Cellulophaga baltica]MDO6767221.1 histidine kinase [Cellulophaga sp. 1_MG-2023]